MSAPGVIDRLDKVKGTDFLQFYVSGSFVREGRLDLLYDETAHYARAQALAGRAHDTLYLPVQSAQTAAAFAPLTSFPYTAAFAIWCLATFVVYGVASWWLWKECTAVHPYGREVAFGCCACPALFSTVTHGQVSILALVCVTAAIAALRRRKLFLAGLAFGCLVFKPHWTLAAVTIFVAAGEWRVVTGIALGCVTQLFSVSLLMGQSVLWDYARMLVGIRHVAPLLEPRTVNTLKGAAGLLSPHPIVAFALYATAAAVTLAITATLWRNAKTLEVKVASVLLGIVLISPHAFEYDLLLLAPVYLLLANGVVAGAFSISPLMMAALCALFVAPLFPGLPDIIRLQFSVTAMIVLLAGLHQVVRRRLERPAMVDMLPMRA